MNNIAEKSENFDNVNDKKRCETSVLTPRYIYFVLEALMGGEIYTHLQKAGSFDEPAAK